MSIASDLQSEVEVLNRIDGNLSNPIIWFEYIVMTNS